MNAMKTDWTPPLYAKTPEERQELDMIFRTSHDSKLHRLFSCVNKETFDKILDAMFLKAIPSGEKVIEQGAVGDFFYIAKSGRFDILVSRDGEPPKKVFEAEPGFAFGELALLYNAPRNATVVATVDSEVWCLERTSFRNLVVRSSEERFNEKKAFLNGCEFFTVLSGGERAALAEVLEEEEFSDDEAILEQGERDDKMFIVRKGKAVACIKGDEGEVEVMQYSEGDYFGEIALLLGEPRKASVYAVGPCTCLYIPRETFSRILGPMKNILERQLEKYSHYQDALQQAAAEEDLGEEAEDKKLEDEEDGDGAGELVVRLKSKVVHRKRERRVTKELLVQKLSTATATGARRIAELQHHRMQAETEEQQQPQTLEERVAQDFSKAALVEPVDAFTMDATELSLYGGLSLHDKFTDNKKLHFFNNKGHATFKAQGEDQCFMWTGPSTLQHNTDIAVICQKGQKSDSDPCPNQDNWFMHQVNGITIYGVCDGHGPFGHLVSFRLVQSLPHLISTNPNVGKDWPLALKEAFLAAQADLEGLSELQNINMEASGSAATVIVHEEQTVHVAFIGDCRVLLGSWTRRNAGIVFCSQDHKPEVPEEKARLEEAGSEVRQVDTDTYRIFFPGKNVPGLSMSRSFGDLAVAGLSREPEYRKFQMQPSDEWYAMMASDGMWEFMDGEEVGKIVGKKLHLKGAPDTLKTCVNASRKRWKHVCGDYCDDITGVLVKWNSRDLDIGKANHSLNVKVAAPPS
mmetsp:Transcript_23305/g.51464  ORF Transcript_23305/g.51464 Transcript_23305/m.51464 type:complete len:747 (-) Transcript_23305:116-2356(-)